MSQVRPPAPGFAARRSYSLAERHFGQWRTPALQPRAHPGRGRGYEAANRRVSRVCQRSLWALITRALLVHRQWQPDCDKGASASTTAERNVASVCAHKGLCDRQAEPGAACRTRTGATDSIEAIEDEQQVFVGDALAAVLDLEYTILPIAADQQAHQSARRRVLERVVEKDQSHLLEAIRVPVNHRRRIVDSYLECDPAFAGDHPNTLRELARQSTKIDVSERELQLSAIGAREFEQIAREPLHAPDLQTRLVKYLSVGSQRLIGALVEQVHRRVKDR
jgi:hypothetical protein